MPVSVIDKAQQQDLFLHPFPHLVLHNALPSEYYEQLANTYPNIETLVAQRKLKNNHLYLKPAVEVAGNELIAPLWREFFAYHCSASFYKDILNLWQDVINRLYPDIMRNFKKPLEQFSTGIRQIGAETNPENKQYDILLDCQFGINSPVIEVSSVRGAHTDSRYKLFAGLLYFRHPQDQSEGGELELYQYRGSHYRFDHSKRIDFDFVESTGMRDLYKIEPRFVEKVKAIPYRSNTLVMWLNTPYSLHGVSPRSITPIIRRYINFMGECYRSEQDGFFENVSSHRPWIRRVWDRLLQRS